MIKNLPNSLEDFILLCENCEKVQRDVLKDILLDASNTEIGKRFAFSTIEDVDMFRHHIPVMSWKDIQPYAKRLEDGEENLLFNSKVPIFVCTSGSTGKIKIMPESQASRDLKALTTKLRIEAITNFSPSAMDGQILPLVNHAIEGYTKSGIPYGSASGITLLMTSNAIKKRVAFPFELLEIDYNNNSDYFLMRFAIEYDVRIIFGNNAGRITQLIKMAQKNADIIIDDIEKGTMRWIEELPKDIQTRLKKLMKPNPKLAASLRKKMQKVGSFLPEVYWSNLKVISCWLSGSVGQYVETLKPFLSKEVLFFDFGYGATEGKFNIITKPNEVAGALNIYSTFYEFKESNSDTFLMAHQLQNNKSYELYITTYSGLYRYKMQDIIYVDGFVATTPKIVFQNKTGDILNICGEKVSASTLIPLVEKAVFEITKNPPTYWCIVPNGEEKYYHFYIELSTPLTDTKKITQEIETLLEELLQTQTLIYPIFREQKLLKKLKLNLMQNGWQKELYKKQNSSSRSNTQVKLPLIYKTLPEKKFIL